ncbi:MAG: hypothetical protein OEZ59_03180 [Deltaproteobacteria bacterium]|nr:hypothetical protein [Deltaproteobacteria bacterium]
MTLIAKEEKRSAGPLIAFIDLLFLLVAFFILLLFFIQHSQQASEERLEVVSEALKRLTGEEVEVEEALERLEPLLERFKAEEQKAAELEQARLAKEQRRRSRTKVRLLYNIGADGRVQHQGHSYTVDEFLGQVVAPLRLKHWVSFRAYASPETPFGEVVRSRRRMLKDSNEFDTYWDNLDSQGAQEGK